MNRRQNSGTQPFHEQPVFNNWDVIPLAWYLLGPSRDLARGKIKAYEIGNQRIVVFRGVDGTLRALDAYCPHMGTDLAIGRVDGNQIRCFFHHWKFSGTGECTDIPCGERTPQRARLQSYDVAERYGFIWVWPDAKALGPVPEYPELEGKPVLALAGRHYERRCHWNVTMINGLDAQHLRTVHHIPIQMSLKTQEDSSGRIIEFRMEGDLSEGTFMQKLFKRVLGGRYAYSMRYVDASVGLLRTLEDVRWFSLFPTEPTRMLFAYTPIAPGRVQVQPIYIARKPDQFLPQFLSFARLFAMAMGFLWLRDEDGKIYDNIRFQGNALLKVDQGVARFIQYVNQLKPSRWSRLQQSTRGESS